MEAKKELTLEQKLNYFIFETRVEFMVEKGRDGFDTYKYDVHVHLKDIMKFLDLDTKNEVAVDTAYKMIRYMDNELIMDFDENAFGDDEAFKDFLRDEYSNEAQRDYDCSGDVF